MATASVSQESVDFAQDLIDLLRQYSREDVEALMASISTQPPHPALALLPLVLLDMGQSFPPATMARWHLARTLSFADIANGDVAGGNLVG